MNLLAQRRRMELNISVLTRRAVRRGAAVYFIAIESQKSMGNSGMKTAGAKPPRVVLGLRARLLSFTLFSGCSALAFGFLAALSGCTTSTEARRSVHETPAPAVRLWPADEPDAPRAVYVQSIARPADAGVKSTGWARFARWVTGSGAGNEPLQKPFGIALDEKDDLCLTDTAANTLCYLDRAKKKWHKWDKAGKVRFSSPVALARHKNIFYVADSGLPAVLVIDDKGKLLRQLTNRLERPSGLAVEGERLFVTDSARHCVLTFDLLGHYLGEFGRRGVGPGELNYPTHIAADREGNLYVTDSMNGRVQLFDLDGKFKAEIGSTGDSTGHFSRPKGVAADSFGHVYVVDGMFDNFQVFDRTGRFLMTLGESGTEPGQFWLPNGIAISSDNRIFVADSYNHRVQVFKYVGPP